MGLREKTTLLKEMEQRYYDIGLSLTQTHTYLKRRVRVA